MRPYWTIFTSRFRILLQYRAAALAGLATQVFFGLVRVMVLTAFFASAAGDSQPMSLAQTITYVWLGQALFRLLPFSLDGDVAAMIRNGNVVYELARPWDIYTVWYMRALAGAISPTVLRGPLLVLFAVFVMPEGWGLGSPASAAAGLLSALAIVLAVLTSAAVTALLSIAMMWTIAGEGLSRLIATISWIACGIVIPLPLLPDAVAAAASWTPFAAIMDLPFRLYMGQIPTDEAPLILLRQVGWIAVLVLGGRAILGRGFRCLVAQGG